MKVTIRGCSDDIIEVEGDLEEEFNGDDQVLVFGDGSRVRVYYGDDGLWHVERLTEGSAVFEVVFRATDSDSKEYSDRATLTGDLVSVDCERTVEELADVLADVDWRRQPETVVREVYARTRAKP